MLLIFILIFSFVVRHVLMQPNELLCEYDNLIQRLPDWLYKPLGGCMKCFAGQLMLWGYIVFEDHYNWKEHLFLVTLIILLSFITEKIYEIKNT